MSQICLVTGASRGIGKAIALELATQGHTVIGTGTSPASAENVTTDLRAARAQGRGAVLDVNDLQQIESVVNEITDEFGPISVLVNNAGVT
ncbi:MAG: SDR family NAD(P)-dependent oxidoreductase, partial [Pseudomonadota bacterium]|nr:SDR family NAD(P)-dependent oxidoreductase [Pseudomonadota bacterium]